MAVGPVLRGADNLVFRVGHLAGRPEMIQMVVIDLAFR
jgi:hypothetical protein